MLTATVHAALALAHYEILDGDEGIYGGVDALPGVWASAATLEASRAELQEVVEDWLLVRLRRGAVVPVLGGIALNLAAAA